jgi:hypothetical protein
VATSFPSQDIVPLFGATVNPSMSRYSEASTYPLGFDVGAVYDFLQTPGVGKNFTGELDAASISDNIDRVGSEYFQPRGVSHILCERLQVATDASPTAVYRYTIEEDIVVPPFVFGNSEGQDGVTRLQNLSLLLTFGNLRRMFSLGGSTVASASYLTDFSVSLVDAVVGANSYRLTAPQLRVTYSTPDPIMQTKISPFVTYPYESFSVFLDPLTGDQQPTAAKLAVTGKNTNALRLVNIPSKLVIGVRPTNQSLINFTPYNAVGPTPAISGSIFTNHWLPITRMQLTVNTRSGIFATYRQRDLWKMSRRNGLVLSYREWKNGGGPVIIDTAFDIGIDAREAAGQAVNVTLQINLDFDATGPYLSGLGSTNAAVAGLLPNITYEVCTIACTPAQCSIGAGTSVFAIQGPSQTQVLNLLSDGSSKDFLARSVVPADDDGAKSGGGKTLQGGGFFHKVGSILKSGAMAGHKLLMDNPELLQHGLRMAGKHLFGGDMSGEGGGLSGGGMSGGGVSGGGISGGGYGRHPRAR